MREIEIQSGDDGQRLDRFLQKLLPKASLSFLQKMIRTKRIKCNKKRAQAAQPLICGDRVQIYLYEEVLEPLEKKEVKRSCTQRAWKHLNILWEDAHIAVIDKPKGIAIHPSRSKDQGDTLVDAFRAHCEQQSPSHALTFRPTIVHRLDYNTEGLVLGAKTHEAAQVLSQGLREGQIHKIYRAFCEGDISEAVQLDAPLWIKGKKQNAWTKAEPLYRENYRTLLQIELKTGRFHQIRKHLSSIGHPLWGDVTYKAKRRPSNSGQALIAYQIILDLPAPYSHWNRQFTTARWEAFCARYEFAPEKVEEKSHDEDFIGGR